MQEFEKLGVFYLGRRYELAARKRTDDLLLYDSRDLVTHAVCVGMTGSGKTGLCLSLIEEAAIDGVPAILIDPKGDLGNLLLTFPDLAPGGLPALDQRGGRRAQGTLARRLRETAGRDLEKGVGGVGRGRGAHPPPQGRRRLRHLHARLDRRPARLDPALVCGAASLGARRRGDPARAGRLHRHRPADACWASTPTRCRAASTSWSRRCCPPRGRAARASIWRG